MQIHHSKQAGSLFTTLLMLITMLGMPVSPVQAGAPVLAKVPPNSRSALVMAMTLVSVASNGLPGNNNSYNPSISANGRYVAYYSMADNLISGDTNETPDAFLRDTQTNVTTRISVDSSGVQGNSWSIDQTSGPSVSADGRYVAFRSMSTNLTNPTTNGFYHIFRRDTQTGTTSLVSVRSSGENGNGSSYNPSISADGRYVVFSSEAYNLVPGDAQYGRQDIFLRDMQANTTTRISVATDGTPGNGTSDSPFISADGHYVAFSSYSNNLVSGDANADWDIFLRDMLLNTTTLVSVNSSGVQGNHQSDYSSISADGRYIVFYSYATNLVSGDATATEDIFLRDRQEGTTTLVSVNSSGVQGNDSSNLPHISADGRYVVFRSGASNLVSGDNNGTWDIFLRDLQEDTTTRLSVNSGGVEGNQWSVFASISADGHYVTFQSDATNLVGGDTNGKSDIFIAPSINLFTNQIYLPLVIR